MSRTAGREHMPSYALQWRAMQWARAAGCAFYDWWGAPERDDDEADGMAGVWRFKQGFGAQFLEGIGAWDYAPSGPLYSAYLKLGRWLIRSGLA
jgi:lipid II:glycine glycyltransferase (peptidoglycan interpeptide bridge formation enzyme)